MATSVITKKPCCKCNKGGATFTCDGCHLSFCLKHASDHRQELSQQMDNIGQQHDILKRDIDEQDINDMLLAQIDQWEKESIGKIRFTAGEARTDLKRLAEESKHQLNDLMNKLSDELRSNREIDDYTENDLDRWMNQLKELRNELEKPSKIEIVENKPSSFYLIKIKGRHAMKNGVINLSPQEVLHTTEKFSKAIGPVVLSNNSCVATCTPKSHLFSGPTIYASVFGCGQYSYGNYNLRFRLNTSQNSAVFVGILESSQHIVDDSSELKSAYGYWSDGGPVTAGSYAEFYDKIRKQPNDEVVLILDCSSRKISYIHERTQVHQEMNVDQKICPLPWKLVVTLWYPDDKIEILHL